MSTAFLFPGQGSQYVGMGKLLAENFAEARDVFGEVDESLGQNLTRLMAEGPDTDLNMTENTQPALMAVSLAVISVLEKQGGISLAGTCAFVAGHSLGEYSALAAAGTFTLADTAKLLKLRGQSMQKAAPPGTGAMAAVLGLSFDDVAAIAAAAAQGDVCQAANDNSDGQVVISGHKAAIERAIALAAEKGAKKSVLLPVSAPFHCALMAPAAAAMDTALAAATMTAPAVPVVANVTAQAERDPAHIKSLLVEQVTGTVRWRESVQWMNAQGVTRMVEIGAGKVLAGLVRRIARDVTCESVETPGQIEALIRQLQDNG